MGVVTIYEKYKVQMIIQHLNFTLPTNSRENPHKYSIGTYLPLVTYNVEAETPFILLFYAFIHTVSYLIQTEATDFPTTSLYSQIFAIMSHLHWVRCAQCTPITIFVTQSSLIALCFNVMP